MKYVYAESYGAVYRFTPKKWHSMLQRVANGETVAYDDYGKIICILTSDITDLDEDQARELLDS